MSPSTGETVIYTGRPSWRSMLDFHLGGVVLALAGGVIGTLAEGWGIAIAVVVGVFALSILLGLARRAATQYTITDRRLYIRRGILSRREQYTAIERVQNVETTQSLFERLLRVGTVDFDTAGTDDSVFQFAGIATPKRVVAAVDLAHDRLARGEL